MADPPHGAGGPEGEAAVRGHRQGRHHRAVRDLQQRGGPQRGSGVHRPGGGGALDGRAPFDRQHVNRVGGPRRLVPGGRGHPCVPERPPPAPGLAGHRPHLTRGAQALGFQPAGARPRRRLRRPHRAAPRGGHARRLGAGHGIRDGDARRDRGKKSPGPQGVPAVVRQLAPRRPHRGRRSPQGEEGGVLREALPRRRQRRGPSGGGASGDLEHPARGGRHCAAPGLRGMHRPREGVARTRRGGNLGDQPQLQGAHGLPRRRLLSGEPCSRGRLRGRGVYHRSADVGERRAGTSLDRVGGAAGQPREGADSRRFSGEPDRPPRVPSPGQPQHRRDLRQGLHLQGALARGDGARGDGELRPLLCRPHPGRRRRGRRFQFRHRLLARAGGDRAAGQRDPARDRRFVLPDVLAERLQQRFPVHRDPGVRAAPDGSYSPKRSPKSGAPSSRAGRWRSTSPLRRSPSGARVSSSRRSARCRSRSSSLAEPRTWFAGASASGSPNPRRLDAPSPLPWATGAASRPRSGTRSSRSPGRR